MLRKRAYLPPMISRYGKNVFEKCTLILGTNESKTLIFKQMNSNLENDISNELVIFIFVVLK